MRDYSKRCPWKAPLEITTHVYSEHLVVGRAGTDQFIRSEAVIKVVDADHRIVFECIGSVGAQEIVKTMNKKYPGKKK